MRKDDNELAECKGKTPQIQVEIDKCGQLLNELMQAIGQLEKRLSGVLRVEVKADETIAEEQGIVPLAHVMREQNLNIHSACMEIQSILERLEL